MKVAQSGRFGLRRKRGIASAILPPHAATLQNVKPTSTVGLIDMSPLIDICHLDELPPGATKIVTWEDLEVGVVNCDGAIYAIEDRCSHDNGILFEGTVDTSTCVVECPRHGSLFDLKTGNPLN